MEKPQSPGPPTILCPNCMAENPAKAHFCSKCITPLDSFAATDPLASITAEADTLGKAARAHRSPIILIGVILIMGPTALVCTLILVGIIRSAWDGDRVAGPTCLLLPLLAVMEFISVGLLIKVITNYMIPAKQHPELDPTNAEQAAFIAEAESMPVESDQPQESSTDPPHDPPNSPPAIPV